MKIKSLPQYERPMEKCLSLGVESLTNGELIAILINSGTREKSAVDWRRRFWQRTNRA